MTVETAQVIPSITTETALVEVPKLVPVIVKVVPPTVGPKSGEIPVTVGVLVIVYLTTLDKVVVYPLTVMLALHS